MELDINYALVYYTTNVNIFSYHWKSYGLALWCDLRLENYHKASQRIKDLVWDEILLDNPQLVGTEIKYSESGELPVIDYSKI